jgi:hypothetical protein
MAHETAVHRIDGELAIGTPTPVDAELAVDGVDEVPRHHGVVEFVENPAHRRAKLVRLNRSGAGTLARITGAMIDWANALAVASDLNERSIRRAADVAVRFRETLERGGGHLPA